jgi:hypothetical protein
MKTTATIAFAFFLSLSGCKNNGHADYGSIKDVSSLTSISKIVADPAAYDGKTVTVKGVIATVCPHSGCFLRLGEGTAQIYVDLEKSGFTVPPGKNVGHVAYVTGTVMAGGAEVKINGTGVRIVEK